MHLLTFSVLKNCKLKWFCALPSRHLADSAGAVSHDQESHSTEYTDDPRLVEVSASWPAERAAERAAVLRDLRVFPDFVSEEEERALLAELEPTLKRMRYEFDHWDNAIEGYRETERSSWSPAGEAVLQRVRGLAFRDSTPLPHAHVLDLAPGGHVRPHVDAVRFCGAVIAGLCLCSSAVLRLQAPEPRLLLHALLPRRALYVMRDVARYQFSHSVLGGEASQWRGRRLLRQRRVAVILRSRPAPPPA